MNAADTTKTRRRALWSWAMYDWANSAFATTVMAGFFPVFFKEYWSLGADATLSTARLGTTISISSLIIAILSPLLGALADLRGAKKVFCFLFMVLGVCGTLTMAFIDKGGWTAAAAAYGVAMFGFTASCVFYDSLLPSIAPGKEADYASALGYGLGYLGGGVLFLLNVAMYLKPEVFGLPDGVFAIKLSFFTVAIWWAIFSIPLFLWVPEPAQASEGRGMSLARMLFASFGQLMHTVRKILANRNAAIFLLAYWLYIDGVYTIMTMAVDFGMSLGFKAADLIAALLIVQFIGFPFAILFSSLAKRWGSRPPIFFGIAIYSVTTVFATMMTESWHFYILAAVIGMVQGGVQALSRSLFSRMTPPEAAGEYFGLFNLVGKFASIIGPALVGIIAYVGGDSRRSLLGVLILFAIGAALLTKVREPEPEP